MELRKGEKKVARCIDADNLLEKLHRMIDYCEKDRKVNAVGALFQVGDAIMDCETADVVEVVRCKDCVHRDPEDKKCDSSFQANGGIFPVGDNDFCSYGERRK